MRRSHAMNLSYNQSDVFLGSSAPQRHSHFSHTAPWIIFTVLLTLAQAAWPECSVDAQGVNFGSYDVFNNENTDSTGNIHVACNPSNSFSIALSAGNGSYTSRFMASGANRLTYNLYINANHTSIWGDGTGVTSLLNNNGTSVNSTVYGRVPARQNLPAGSYSDTIVVTITF